MLWMYIISVSYMRIIKETAYRLLAHNRKARYNVRIIENERVTHVRIIWRCLWYYKEKYIKNFCDGRMKVK